MVKTSSADFLLPKATWLKNLQHAFRLRGLCVTRLSGGHSCRFELRTFLASNDEQSNSSGEREPAENRWDGDSVLSLCRDVHWSHIQNMLAAGVIKALISEGQRAQNHQNNSSQRAWFHIFDARARRLSLGPE